MQSKLKTFFLEINLSQVSSLPILKIYENGRADNISGVCIYLFHIIVYLDGKCRKSG